MSSSDETKALPQFNIADLIAHLLPGELFAIKDLRAGRYRAAYSKLQPKLQQFKQEPAATLADMELTGKAREARMRQLRRHQTLINLIKLIGTTADNTEPCVASYAWVMKPSEEDGESTTAKGVG